MVGPIEDHVQHLHKYFRIAVIEIPLVLVKDRHHPFLRLFIPGEIARIGLRKDLRHRLLKHIRDGAIIKHVEIVLVLRITRNRLLHPRMLIGGMVNHNIECD